LFTVLLASMNQFPFLCLYEAAKLNLNLKTHGYLSEGFRYVRTAGERLSLISDIQKFETGSCDRVQDASHRVATLLSSTLSDKFWHNTVILGKNGANICIVDFDCTRPKYYG
jgi:hypothetical protein